VGPKVAAAIRFLEGSGKRAIISHLDRAMAALRGETGTHVVRQQFR
jgi:carbamate kinase